MLAAGLPLERFRSQFARATDTSRGRQIINHVSDRARGIATFSSIIATQCTHAVGTAYAYRLRREPNRVAFCTFGEGATSEGEWHEAMNYATVFHVPVVFVCENNLGISTAERKQMAKQRVATARDRVGLEGVTVDGFDPVAVYEAVLTRGFLEEFGPKRVVDTPLAEASIVGIAVGMAMQGLRPVAEIQFADFIYPGVQPDRRRGGQDALSLQRRLHLSAGDSHALRRRRPRRALALGLDRGAVLPRARAEDRRAVDAARHQGTAQRRDRGSRSGALPRAQEDVSLGASGEVPDGHFTIPIGKADVKRAGTRAHASSPTATTSTKRSRPPTSSRARGSRSR